MTSKKAQPHTPASLVRELETIWQAIPAHHKGDPTIGSIIYRIAMQNLERFGSHGRK